MVVLFRNTSHTSDDLQEEIQKKTGYVVMRAEGVYDVDANTSIDQLSDDLDITLPEVRLFFSCLAVKFHASAFCLDLAICHLFQVVLLASSGLINPLLQFDSLGHDFLF